MHIYRFISQHTVEEALLRKANQKRSLDDIVIQKGEFDWRSLFVEGSVNDGALTRALGEFEDDEDAQAAQLAAQEEMELEDEDAQDFGTEARTVQQVEVVQTPIKEVTSAPPVNVSADDVVATGEGEVGEDEGDGDGEEGRTIDDYMIDFVNADPEFFSTADWNV